jgi:imidazolonepropionase-like amidohydrolase
MHHLISLSKWKLSGILAFFILLTACSSEEPAPVTQQVQAPAPVSNAVVYTGARIITGDGSAAIENGTLIVEDGAITNIGGNMEAPAGARVVNLSGATIMPMMIDTHVHLSTDRDSLIQDLRNRVTFGVSAAMSLGADFGDDVFQVRDETIAGAARYFTAGRGITRPEEGRAPTPHWVSTEEEARAAVQAETTLNVDIIKIWVDDRNGNYEKLTPALYGAIIDEAHLNGTRVSAHIFNLSDAKGLLEAGLDAFAHGVRDMDIDDEFVAMVQARPEVVLVPNLPGRGVPTDYSWLEGYVSDDQLQQLMAATVNPQAQEAFGIQARNLDRLNDAGMRIAVGTDGNTAYGMHVEMEDMVASGMTPAEVIVAATSSGAEFLGIDDSGTLAQGMSADFIVLNANPLDDITNTREIRDVYFQGELADR